MMQTRFFTVAALALAGAAALAVALTVNLQPARTPGRAGAEALAIYHASEWSRAEAARNGGAALDYLGLNAQGRAVYHASERERVPVTLPAQSERLWLAIYHASEWNRLAPAKFGLGPEGLAIYSASEHTSTAQGTRTMLGDEGLRIYHASEWGRDAVRGSGWNAYQRSEWLGADR